MAVVEKAPVSRKKVFLPVERAETMLRQIQEFSDFIIRNSTDEATKSHIRFITREIQGAVSILREPNAEEVAEKTKERLFVLIKEIQNAHKEALAQKEKHQAPIIPPMAQETAQGAKITAQAGELSYATETHTFRTMDGEQVSSITDKSRKWTVHFNEDNSYMVVTSKGRAVLKNGQVVDGGLSASEVLETVTAALLQRRTIDAADALAEMRKHKKENS